MTTATTTRTSSTTTLPTTSLDDDLAGALDGLAVAAEQAPDDVRTRAVLAAVVQRLEDAADAGLGPAGDEPLVVLQRRFGRAHVRLAGRPAADLEAGLLLGLVSALHSAPAGASPRAVQPASAVALVGC